MEKEIKVREWIASKRIEKKRGSKGVVKDRELSECKGMTSKGMEGKRSKREEKQR
jgi:hypothetical protein